MMDAKIEEATKKFFEELEEKHGIEVPQDYIDGCIQSNKDSSTVDEFESEEKVYNYFLEEYRFNENQVLEVLEEMEA